MRIEAVIPLEDTTAELAEEMIAAVAEQWRKDFFQAGTYQLELGGVFYPIVSRFTDALRRLRGLQNAHFRSFGSGHALLEVTYRGTLEELADKISRFKDPPAEVTGLQANTLEISVRS